jgi:nitrite reductase/ring-hydroxylating ferredoxin subunit
MRMAMVNLIPLSQCRLGGGTFVEHGGRELAVFRLALDTPRSALRNPSLTNEAATPLSDSSRPSFVKDARTESGAAGQGLGDPERVLVIDNACPHSGGNLSGGSVEGKIVTCRQHEWKFDLGTGICTESNRAKVQTYPAEVRDGVVWVELPD